MMPLKIREESLRELSFFSKELNLSLKFNKSGLLNGTLNYSVNLLCFTKEVTGIYVTENEGTRLSFITEWKNPNLTSCSITSFYGEILRYNVDSKCLVLHWLLVNESDFPIGSFMERDATILIDSNTKDLVTETKLIIGKLPKGLFVS